jgi:hypothetical protein
MDWASPKEVGTPQIGRASRQINQQDQIRKQPASMDNNSPLLEFLVTIEEACSSM